MKNMEADVVVIAGGASGLAAACAAAEKGASVILVEKAATVGGAANMGMGFFAAGSRMQKEQMVQFTPDDAFHMFMESTHWTVDANMIRNYVNMSADTVEWIQRMGVEFLGAFKNFPTSEATWHIVKAPNSNKFVERSASYMIKAMLDYATALGVQVLLSTPATEIILEDGHVAGVLCEFEGKVLKIGCDCAIICTGGFGDNPEMIGEQTGFEWGKNLFSFRIPGLNGDGIKMAWKAGAAKSRTMVEMIYMNPAMTNIYNHLIIIMRQPNNLVVNLDGQRIMNEDYLINTPYSANCFAQQKGSCAFSILSDEVLDHLRATGLDFMPFQHGVKNLDKWNEQLSMWKAGQVGETGSLASFSSGDQVQVPCFAEADSIEELAEQLGINKENLKKTVDEYNSMCGGLDKQFCKSPSHMQKIQGQKFYASRWYPAGYGTLGGIKINEKTEVINTDGNVIPGLYAAGMDANTIYGDTYIFYMPGNTMGFALNSGRMAGYNAVTYLDEQFEQEVQ